MPLRLISELWEAKQLAALVERSGRSTELRLELPAEEAETLDSRAATVGRDCLSTWLILQNTSGLGDCPDTP